jgi:hypothetical protein
VVFEEFTIKVGIFRYKMKSLLNYLRQKPEFYTFLKKIYGATIGVHWLKTLYLKKIGLWNGEKRIKLINDLRASQVLSDKIKSKKPFMLGRYGSTEFRNLFEDNFENLCFYSGFFPKDRKLLKRFRKTYFESSKKVDYLCVWNYKNHFNRKRKWIKNFPNIKEFFNLGVVGHDQNWIKSLENKRILVVHPFKATIEKQMKRRRKLGILPKMKSLKVIQAVQTIAGERDKRFKTWFDALAYMKKEIDKKDFDIALIGCGAYGLPLAAHVKRRGKQAIHVGGVLQLFFGIRGKRWENNKDINMNSYWINPLGEDVPAQGKKIEGGCYW